MTAQDNFLRRKLLRVLEDQHLSRDEVARTLEAVEGLEESLLDDARRRGLYDGDVAEALACFGTGFARRAVKRFFLRPAAL